MHSSTIPDFKAIFSAEDTTYAELVRELGSDTIIKLCAEITAQNNRITKSRELLLSEAIEVSDFKAMKAACEKNIARLEAKLEELSQKLPSEINFQELSSMAGSNLKNIVSSI